jgi:hypothetical protein
MEPASRSSDFALAWDCHSLHDARAFLRAARRPRLFALRRREGFVDRDSADSPRSPRGFGHSIPAEPVPQTATQSRDRAGAADTASLIRPPILASTARRRARAAREPCDRWARPYCALRAPAAVTS